MKLFCNKNVLQESISIAQKAVTGKSTMPILQGIFIKAENNSITLTGSDIDLSIKTIMDADVVEEGSIVIDSKIFGEIIRKLPNDVIEITSKDNNIIEIKCQKSKFNLIHMNSDDFPELPQINENIIFSIPEGLLKNMVRSTIFATSQEETRPILTGLLFEIKNKTLNLVALDGYRLAVKSKSIDSENSISAVIPGKTLNEVSKILNDKDEKVNITFTPNHILFSIGKTKIISRLLEGDFINYKSIIPKEHNLKIIAKRIKLLECIERASLMGKDGNTSLVKLNITDDRIVITSNSQLGMVREEMGIILQGDDLEIAFNSKYLIDVLKVIEEEEIVMELSSSISPCVIKNNEANDCTYLVLPVRLAGN